MPATGYYKGICKGLCKTVLMNEGEIEILLFLPIGLKSLCFDDSAIVSAYVLATRCNIALVRELSDTEDMDNVMEAADDKVRDDSNEDLIQFIVELLVVSKDKSTSDATKVCLNINVMKILCPKGHHALGNIIAATLETTEGHHIS